MTVHVILPSEHVKRDFAFRETYDLFFLAGARTEEERKWHLEFCDSRMQQASHAVLNNGTVLHEFVVGGVQLRSGDVVSLELGDAAVVHPVIIGAGSFAGREAGVRANEDVHVGDFIIPCSRDSVQVGVLNARHWLPDKHGRVTWHPIGLPTVQVMRIVLELSCPRPPPHPPVSVIEELPG